MNRALLRGWLVFLLTACVWLGLPAAADTKTHLLPGGMQEVDSETLKELLFTFEQAELAMQAQDLDRIVALYSDEYLFHGFKKADLQKIWKQLFDHYKDLESFHTFSVVRLAGSGVHQVAEITCSGVLWGTSRDTTLRSPVDSWYEEIHYLKKENGRWRIVGNAGGEAIPVLQFGVAPHPLF
jgi:ketosteroid isomerase-like protein